MGQLPRRDTVPAYVTPYEFKKYYDDIRRAVRVTLLPVNVDGYVAQIKNTPTDAELKELYEKFKKDEWTPESTSRASRSPSASNLNSSAASRTRRTSARRAWKPLSVKVWRDRARGVGPGGPARNVRAGGGRRFLGHVQIG